MTQTKVEAEYLAKYDLVFATGDFYLFINKKSNVTFSRYTIPDHQLIANQLSPESISERVKIYQAFGLQNQKIVEQFHVQAQQQYKLFYGIIQSQWFDLVPTQSIEIWYQNGRDTQVIVSQLDVNINFEQQKNELLRYVYSLIKNYPLNKVNSSIEERQLNRFPASQSKVADCRPSIFNEVSLLEGPLRKLISAAENNLQVSCHTPQSKKLSNAEIAFKVIGGCLKGVAGSIVQLGKFIYEIMNFFIKIHFNPAYQKNIAGKTVSVLQQAPIALGHVLGELWRNPAAFIANLYQKIIGSFDKKWKEFKSCNSEYQVKMGCMIFTDFVSGGVFLKLLMKAKQIKTAAHIIDDVAPGVKLGQAQAGTKRAGAVYVDLNTNTKANASANPERVQSSELQKPEVQSVIQSHLQNEMLDRSDVQILDGFSPPNQFRSVREEKHFTVLTELDETQKFLNNMALEEFDPIKFDQLVTKRDELYKKSISIMSEELKAKGIQHTLVNGDKHLAKQLKVAEDYIVARSSLEAATDRLKSMRDEKMPQVLIDDQLAIVLKRRQLAQELKQGLDSKTLRVIDQIKGNSVSHEVRNLLAKPHIVLTGQQPIKILNTAVEKMNAEVVISPYTRLKSNQSLGWVSTSLDKPVFQFPLEAVFDLDISRNSTFYHELQHLRHEQQRVRGIERPLNISFQAKNENQLFKLNGETDYQKFFSMEELETWVSDIRRSNSPQFEINVKRLYDLDSKKPVVYYDSTYENAKLVKQMANVSIEQIQSARKLIRENPHIIQVEMPSTVNKYPVVRIPIYKEGKEIGQTKITLIKLKNNSSKEVQAEVLRYIDLSEAKAMKYQAFAEREIRISEQLRKSFGGKSMDEILRSLGDDIDE